MKYKKDLIGKYMIDISLSVRNAMKKLDESNRKILCVIKENKFLLGTLTDGDIRRWIINGNSLDDDLSNVYNQNPILLRPDYQIDEVKEKMLLNKIPAIPIVDDQKVILDLLFWDDIFDNKIFLEAKGKLDIPVVIMAGGKGARLAPFTNILPKPLIPVGDKSILELIIAKYREYSIDQFYISIFHKGKMIKAYFDEINPEYSISFLEEENPLGTAGVLSKLNNQLSSDSLFLTNCDTIINCNYQRMFEFHNENNYSITLVGCVINHKVPYGICEIESEGKLISLTEKPEYSYLVSTGMYLLNKTVLELIPENEFYNMTDLIEKVRNNGGDVGVFPISEKSWLDTGEWKEYKKTIDQLTL